MTGPKLAQAEVRMQFEDGTSQVFVFGPDAEYSVLARRGRMAVDAPVEPDTATVHLSGSP